MNHRPSPPFDSYWQRFLNLSSAFNRPISTVFLRIRRHPLNLRMFCWTLDCVFAALSKSKKSKISCQSILEPPNLSLFWLPSAFDEHFRKESTIRYLWGTRLFNKNHHNLWLINPFKMFLFVAIFHADSCCVLKWPVAMVWRRVTLNFWRVRPATKTGLVKTCQ